MSFLNKDQELESPFQKQVKKCVEGSSTHYLNILDVGDEALLARIHLIRCARRFIDIQTFIWANDETGRFFYYELIAAAKRGVQVRLIIDQWASAKDAQWAAFIATVHTNLTVKYYNPSANEIHPSSFEMMREIALHFRQVNHRMHNKVFVVDGEIGITGGRNYEDDYYDRGVRRNFIDRDVLVIGPVVKGMAHSFQEYWDYALAVDARQLLDVARAITQGNMPSPSTWQDFQLGHRFDEVHQHASDCIYIEELFIKNMMSSDQVRFVADVPGREIPSAPITHQVVAKAFLDFFNQAQDSLVVQSPYLVLDQTSDASLAALRRARPQMDILIATNSLASTDNIYTYAFACKERLRYVRRLRFRIFEFKPFPGDYVEMIGYGPAANEADNNKARLCCHAKSFVVDESAVWIGSFNMDPRSFYLNTETALIVHDRDVAASVRARILRDMSPPNSWTVGRRQKVPLIAWLSGLIARLLAVFPWIKTWPFCYTGNYELKEGKYEVPFYHKDFGSNYHFVGVYPGVDNTCKETEVTLLKAFIKAVRPIL